MSIAARTLLALILVSVAVVVWAWDLNAGLVRNGCIGAGRFDPSTGTVHFEAFPRPRFFCLYTLKSGRVVRRSW